MFSLFKKKKRPLPDLSPAMMESAKLTVAVCSRQIEQFFGLGVTKLPFISSWLDNVVGIYASGFLQGTFLVNHADLTWAKGDRGLADLGFTTAASVVVTGLILPNHPQPGSEDQFVDRCLSCHRMIVDMHGTNPPPEDVRRLDAAGGTDGMAASAGKPLPKGGQLLYILKENVSLEEKRKALASR